ncbi:MAG: triose-phosphate isomerase [Rhodospirillales bacterium]|nr:triose-phosphate isomerase [Rhodospirillales bacterium]
MAPLIAGNWKMHGSLASAAALAGAVRAGWQARQGAAELLVCPAAIHLPAVAAVLAGSPIAWGGQDCHAAPQGAHTGDIAAPMLADCGARYVILGHSERRAEHGESDVAVRAKAMAAAAAGLRPILCVGENEAERNAGQAEARVGAQLRGGVPAGFAGDIAYEPVWAIGTGRTPTEAEVAAMHGFIRATLRDVLGAGGAAPRILYGGSVKPGNAAALLGLAEVGGALIGGASLKAEDFLAIAMAARG